MTDSLPSRSGGDQTQSPSLTTDDVRGRDKLAMLIATGARLALGLLTFILLARFLGPEQFGIIATAIAVASVVDMITTFGLVNYVMRMAAIDLNRSTRIVGDALATKVALGLLALSIAVCVIVLTLPKDVWLATICVFAGVFAYSLADLSIVVIRVHRRFDIEAKLIVTTAVAMLSIVGGTAYLTGSLAPTAIAFLVTRILYLAVVRIGIRRWSEPIRKAVRSFPEIWQTLSNSGKYAIDSILTSVTTQIDVLVFATILTIAEMGIYQAGTRLVQSIVPVAVVLSSVYLPTLSATYAQPGSITEFARRNNRMQLEFMAIALIAGIGFVLVGPLVTEYVYGPQYDALQPLWPGFAAYAILRFGAAGFGLQAVAEGRIYFRIVAQLASLAGFVVAAFLIVPRTGLGGASTALAIMGLTSFAFLASRSFLAARSWFLLALICVQLACAGAFLAWAVSTWS